jgi:hypothetical protein
MKSARHIFIALMLSFTTLMNCGPEEVGISVCLEDLNEQEAKDNGQIVEDYNNSIHELIACGNITNKITNAFIDLVFQILTGDATSSLPNGVSYVGEGVYRTQTSNVAMDIYFINSQSNSIGGKDEVIKYNLFNPENYLINSNVIDEGNAYKITFESTGPLVELLGFGAQPSNPIIFKKEIESISKLNSKLGVLRVASNIIIDDKVNNSVVTYEVILAENTTIGQVLTSTFKYDVIDANVRREDIDQDLFTIKWELAFSSGGLTGTVEFNVIGGHHDFIGILTWLNSGLGVADLKCE